jgi:hydrogenase nickel incorporation protein HypA/HybF
MHELAVADAIAAIALDHAGDRRVRAVEVQIGHLRQVVPDALAFAFELVAAGTNLEGAALEIEHVPVRVRCTRCGDGTEQSEFPLVCTSCGSVEVDVVAGDELLVQALELEEELATVGGR